MSAESGAGTDEGAPSVDNQNVASGGAHVDQQIGVHVGDTTIHHDHRTYHINPDDTPARKQEVARNLLDGGAPRRAEEILDDLLRHGCTSTEWAYLYALAVMSERSIIELSGKLLDRLKAARRICSQEPHDQWSDAFDVVWELLRWARREYGGQDDSGRDYAFGLLQALPIPRQAEIFRHLDAIIKDVQDERWEADLKARMLKERTVPERKSLSEKFFEPDPAEPKPYPRPPLRPSVKASASAALGVVGLVVGVTLLVLGPFRAALLLDLGLLTLGGHLIVRYGTVVRSNALLREENEPRGQDGAARQPISRFDKDISAMVDYRFKKIGPGRGSPGAEEWAGHTADQRAHLKARIVRSYSTDDIAPANIRWLVDWHAERADAQWGSGFGARSTPVGAVWGYRLGLLVVVAALFDALLGGEVWAVLVLATAGRLAVRDGLHLAATRHANLLARIEDDRLHSEEVEAHQALVASLEDRPDDSQIAWWHTLDKFYLVSDAIKRAQLPRQEVVEALVLTERAPFARRSRLQYGPPRYEAYNVHILLLTHHGVRAFKLRLDAHTGEARNEERQVFNYDKIASARVTERGVRTTTADDSSAPDVEEVKSGTFHMVLMSGEKIELKVDHFSDQRSDGETDAEYTEVAYETSGIKRAIPILESIVSEGENWIARDRERRKQWAHDWDEPVAVN
ncbi:MAG: hypothetical protein HOY78_10630 [Saccharothrix sp.]|nr:hypothetical protein [Saccharothrix sp.]